MNSESETVEERAQEFCLPLNPSTEEVVQARAIIGQMKSKRVAAECEVARLSKLLFAKLAPEAAGLAERDAFEVWAKQYHPDLAWQTEPEMYLPNSVQYAWVAWQARAALP